MDEIKLIRELTADLPDTNDEDARAAARLALLEKAGPSTPDPRPRSHRFSPRGILALGGAGALAAIVAGIVVLGSGSRTESAAAEALRETAAIAASTNSQTEAQPGPGQFLYTRSKSIGFESWIPDPAPSEGGSANAMLEISYETWRSPGGAIRSREAMGAPEFLAAADQQHWEEAGRPLPRGAFDPGNQEAIDHIVGEGGRVLETGPGLLDMEFPAPRQGFSGDFPDVSALPTDPVEFRRYVEKQGVPGVFPAASGADPLDSEETINAIWNLLSLPNATPALRATAFNALAEMPGIELDRDATDLAGRSGYAIGRDEPVSGTHSEYIFDPETSEILGRRMLLTDSKKFSGDNDLPTGLTIDETVYLQSGVVDSTRETVEERNGGPVATTGPIYRK